MQIDRLISFAGIMGIALALSACDPATPSQVHTGKIRVKDQMVTETVDLRPDPARVSVIAEDIRRSAKGEVALTIPYPAGKPGGEKEARRQGAAYKKAFAAHGIKNVSVALVPMMDKSSGKVVIAYYAVKAMPAEGCNRLPGYQGAEDITGAENYQFGCETQTAISRMVADPTDLLGKAGTQDGDSSRSGTVLRYRAGVPNQPMQGLQASTVGSGG